MNSTRKSLLVAKPSQTAPRHLRTGLIAVALAATTVLAGCGADSHSQTAPTTGSVTSGSPPTTSPKAGGSTPPPAATTTTVQGPTGPEADYPAAQSDPPSLAGAYPRGTTVNLVTVVKTLTTYEDWVWSHPNPTLVANYELNTGNAYDGEVKDITQFRDRGLHAAPTPAEIDFVKVTQQPKPQPALSDGHPSQIDGHQWFVGGLATVVYNLISIPMLDADGTKSTEAFNPAHAGPTAYAITLVQGKDGRFRIDDSTQLDPPGGVTTLENQQ